ncbi:MAG: hypothetical protein HY928_09885 [Elusimicrobia bacterium]|nr:hypothetical protein [Elusimicrobiota bacterium]
MGPSVIAPLLALALLPATAVHGQEWGEFDRPYLETVVGLLKRLRSTREHWAFVSRRKIDLVVTDNPAHVDDSVVGAYDMVEERMFLDEVRLLEGAEQLLDEGASAGTTAKVLAWKSMFTVVHELTHAKTHDQVRRLVGRPIAFPSVEDERLAFYEGCLALFELFEERPELWERGRILDMERVAAGYLEAWLEGPGVLERAVAQTYEERPQLLKEKPEMLLARVDERIRSLRSSVADMRALQRVADKDGAEMTGIARRRFKDLAASLRYAERALAVQVSTREAVADPVSLEKLRAFYRESLAERRALLEARRPRKP